MKDNTGLPKRVTVDVKRCARCGKDHKQLSFTSLTSLIRRGSRYTHWAPCPTNGEPILMIVTVDAKDEKPAPNKKRKRKLTWKEKGWFSPTQAFGPRSLDC